MEFNDLEFLNYTADKRFHDIEAIDYKAREKKTGVLRTLN